VDAVLLVDPGAEVGLTAPPGRLGEVDGGLGCLALTEQLISEFSSRRSPVTSASNACCSPAVAGPPRPLRATGMGMNDSLGRRPARTTPVGPPGPSSKYASGAP